MSETTCVAWGDVLFTPEEIENEQWLHPPGYSTALVSTLGRVKRIAKVGVLYGEPVYEYVLAVPLKTRTTKGFYYSVSVRPDVPSISPIQLVHRLVLLTFQGPSNSETRTDVNHKDGNKINNRIENLEWMSRKENVDHAFKTGLNKTTLKVIRTDLQSDEVKEYHSLSSLASEWGLKYHQALARVLKSKRDPIDGRYVYKIDEDASARAKRAWMRDIVAKDYVTGKLVVADSAVQLSGVIGILPGVITLNVRNAADCLTGGYVFRELAHDIRWPEYTVEEALASRQSYQNKKPQRSKEELVYVKDLLTSKVTKHSTVASASKQVGISGRGSINNVGDNLRTKCRYVHGQYVIQTHDSTWPVVEDGLIQWLIKNKDVRNDHVVKVTDLKLNSTGYWRSIAVFAQSIGQSKKSIGRHMAKKDKTPYLDRYRIEHMSLYCSSNDHGSPSE